MKKIFAFSAMMLLIFTACLSTGETVKTQFPATPQPTTTKMKVLPTSSSLGDSIIWDDLQVTMDDLEITQEYLTEFGSTRTPPAGSKFLWVHIQLKNTGLIELDVPLSEHFSILYAATELKPTYGHRASYTDYTTLDPVIFPDQQVDGWLRFDIPIAAELGDLRFVFIPESAQVGASFKSPNYPYAENKPTYVWKCVP